MKIFGIRLIFYISLLALSIFAVVWYYLKEKELISTVFGIFSLIFCLRLYNLTTAQNKKLARLFESIKYQDFNILFKKDNAWGHSFKDLNKELNEVVKSFNQERSEREASYHFIQAIVKQLTVGVLVINSDKKVELSNGVAGKLLGLYRIGHFSDIEKSNTEFAKVMDDLKNGENKVFSLKNKDISIYMTELLVRGRKLKLFSLQDIHSELQTKELEAWQNLTKVLRHEIMNSLTPIISLTETAEDIVKNDLKSENREAYLDLLASMQTIKNRSKGILNFVNAYREFTKIPAPQFGLFWVSELKEAILPMFSDSKVLLEIVLEQDFELLADKDQITQVLINLVKNANEALLEIEQPKIQLSFIKNLKEVFISVSDNGQGIKAEHLDQIFVPFYSTKSTGSGVGLSLSRQIIQQHGGKLTYTKNEFGGATFMVELKGVNIQIG